MAKQLQASERQGCGDHRRCARDRAGDRGGAAGAGRARVAIGDLDAELTRQAAAELGAGAIGLPLDVTSREQLHGLSRSRRARARAARRARQQCRDRSRSVSSRASRDAVTAARARRQRRRHDARLQARARAHAAARHAATSSTSPRGSGRTPSRESSPTPRASTRSSVSPRRCGASSRAPASKLHLILPSLIGTDMAPG